MADQGVITKIKEIEANPCPPRTAGWTALALALGLIWLSYKSAVISGQIWQKSLLTQRLVTSSAAEIKDAKIFSKNFEELVALNQDLRSTLYGGLTTSLISRAADSLAINFDEKIGLLPPEASSFKSLLGDPTEADVERVIELMRNTGVNPRVIEALNDAHDQLVKIREDREKRQDIERKQQELLRKMHRLRGDYEQIGQETAELFNLSPWLPTEDLFDPNLYTVGLLKDLPALNGLPDGLNTIQELEVALAKLSSAPPTGPEVPAKIESLRRRALALAAEIEQSKTSIKENETSLNELEGDSDETDDSALVDVRASVQQAVQRLVGLSPDA